MFFTNPFSPGKRLTSPALFAGRQGDLHDVLQRVVQAAGDNAMHTLITGERGIGKSSFSSQLQGILRNDENYIDLLGPDVRFPYKFVVVEHVAQSSQGPGDVAINLVKELSSETVLQKALKRVDLSLDLGPIKATINKDSADTTDLINEFVAQLAKIVKSKQWEADGLVLVVDEVDRIADKSGVSTFFKVATERMSALGINNVAIVLVGLLGTLEKLTTEHPSVGRVFLPHPLPLLEKHETRQLLERAVENTPVSIADEAYEMIHDRSGGYPNAVHLIGEAAFTAAMRKTKLILPAIVDDAVDRVVEMAAPEEFGPLYLKYQGRTRQILRFMADQPSMDVPSKDIVAYLNVKPTDISNNFDTLLRSDVLVRPKDGHYRLRDPLFREYLRDVSRTGVEPVQRRPKKRDAMDALLNESNENPEGIGPG